MNYFEKMLLTYLWDSELELKITGFDMEGFQKAVNEAGKRRLKAIECIAFEDRDLMTDGQKIEAIQSLFLEESL